MTGAPEASVPLGKHWRALSGTVCNPICIVRRSSTEKKAEGGKARASRRLSRERDGGLASGAAGRDGRKGTESRKHDKVCPWTVMGYRGPK